MNAGFQTQVNTVPAVGVEGDFCSLNVWTSYTAGPGGLVAGASGAIIGRWGWTVPPNDADGAPALVNCFSLAGGAPQGFVHRTQSALITQYLSDATLVVPAGYQMTLLDGGDFWVKNAGSGQALPGMKAYASFLDGTTTFAATGSATTGGSGTSSSIASSTSSVTGSIAGNIMTVTAVGSGTLYPGTTLSGTGVASGTQIVSQIGGTTGGVGTYYVSIPEQSVASTTISGTYGTLTVGGTVTGTFNVGDPISGSGVATGTVITAKISGTGGAGTYVVNNNTVVPGPETISAIGNFETKWVCTSSALNGELAKISSHARTS